MLRTRRKRIRGEVGGKMDEEVKEKKASGEKRREDEETEPHGKETDAGRGKRRPGREMQRKEK